MVSNTTYKHKKMFGTKVGKENGEPQDPCKGDGGGPLMSRTKDSEGQPRWVIIGKRASALRGGIKKELFFYFGSKGGGESRPILKKIIRKYSYFFTKGREVLVHCCSMSLSDIWVPRQGTGW